MRRGDRWALGLLLAFGLLLFAPTIPFAGFHLDDFALDHLYRGPWSGVWRMFLDYVPGRNLFIVYEAALYGLCGHQPLRLHLAGLALDLLNVSLFYALLRRLGSSSRWAFLAAGLFLVYPNHGETHFWTFAIAQNLLPATLVLAAALWITRGDVGEPVRLGGALALFLLALFDYDQVFLLWIPILLIGYCGDKRPRRARGALAAAAFLASDLAHVLFRHLAAVSAGGRPVIVWSRLWPSALSAGDALLIPMVKLPRYEFLGVGPLSWRLVGVLCAAGGAAWIFAARRLPDDGDPAPAQLRLVGVGLLWTAAAYFPNLFWYLNPRHHYLPTAGWLMAGAGAGVLVAPAVQRTPRRIVAALAAAAFGLAASFDFAEGRAWAASSRLLNLLSAETRRWPPADNIYVFDAPTSLGPAPGLGSSVEAAFAAAGDASLSVFASIAPAASRRGLFSGCESDLFGDDGWSWRPFKGARVFVYDGRGSFARAGRLRIESPGSPPEVVSLGEGPAAARLRPPLWLERAEPDGGAPAAGAALGAVGGVELAAASLRPLAPGVAELELVWRSSRREDFAFLPIIDDAAGRLFEPRDRPKGRRETLWPAYDDLKPASSWAPGAAIQETWRLRLPRPATGSVTARLELFERAESGPWRRFASLSAPVASSDRCAR